LTAIQLTVRVRVLCSEYKDWVAIHEREFAKMSSLDMHEGCPKSFQPHIVIGRTNQNYRDDWKPIYLHTYWA